MRNYEYSINITVNELKAALAFAEENKIDVIAAHFQYDPMINGIFVSDTDKKRNDASTHVDITDYAAA